MPIEILYRKVKLLGFLHSLIKIKKNLNVFISFLKSFQFYENKIYFTNFITSSNTNNTQYSILIPLNYYLKILKINFLFQQFIDSVVIDWPSHQERFELIYNFLNIAHPSRLFISIYLEENILKEENILNKIDNKNMFNSYLLSTVSLYKNSNWIERENWDMFGIFFFENPDLRRILTDYGFEGFPLRKDFPLTGFLELRYDDEQKSIIYEEVELTQEFRFFDFESPWKRNEIKR